MEALKENPFILSLATWAWDSDPSPLVDPSTCLASIPFLTTPCLSRLFAKAIGIGIILSSCVNKAPVIKNILDSKSVAGLSVYGTYGEVILYGNAAFYNILNQNPFTAYGETFMVGLQTIIVVVMIWMYNEPKIEKRDMALAVAGFCAYVFVVFYVLTPSTYYMLMVYNPMVLVSTRGAQIMANYKNKQTGALSIATTSMNLLGSLVRVATTIKEVGWDFHILRSYSVSIFLNVVMFAQILMYKENTEKFFKSLAEKKKD